jgi:hypothetical protein
MAELRIGKMSLDLEGVPQVDAARLARLIGEKLAAAKEPAGAGQIRDSVSVGVSPTADISTDRLAELVVSQILAELKRSV